MAAHVKVSMLRLNTLPAGVRLHMLWNGRIADNGDGLPPLTPGSAVGQVTPLTPQSLEVWPVNAGKAGYGGEAYGRGAYGHEANTGSGQGYGREPYGRGEYGYFNDYLEWSTSDALPWLRDGAYLFAARLESRDGQVQSDALVEVSITVAGTPRPPSDVSFTSYAAGTLSIAWRHSPDELST